MTHLVLLALLAGDGGTRWDDPLYALCPAAPPSVVLPNGSRVLTPERVARLDCIMFTADERRRQLEAGAPFLSRFSLVTTAVFFVAGIVLGAWAAFEVLR